MQLELLEITNEVSSNSLVASGISIDEMFEAYMAKGRINFQRIEDD